MFFSLATLFLVIATRCCEGRSLLLIWTGNDLQYGPLQVQVTSELDHEGRPEHTIWANNPFDFHAEGFKYSVNGGPLVGSSNFIVPYYAEPRTIASPRQKPNELILHYPIGDRTLRDLGLQAYAGVLQIV
ncbi:hypothetical protein PCANC_23620 [Puccinia coronata f. sp. avenae]|uniref:Uncharacterized protein n=1 Tax=Puccinia coronata f. sp. avenae TaxID=200324 RepID=A0A2N5S8K7_9BASI|nr:hypothetical protein PCANC_23620 [Puccinia coronata f. sp. avenae]PLW44178.1 hypothetical protein PCASD_09552 [Puccinia coronata f. sp. avenae]